MRFVLAQICGILLLFLLLILSNRQKVLRLKSTKAYFFALYLALLCLTLDITSVFFIIHSDMVSEGVLHWICKLYLFSLVGVGFSAFNYLMMELYIRDKVKFLLRISIGLLILYCLFISVSRIEIMSTADEVYTYAEAVNITYFASLSYVIMTIVCIFVFKDDLNRKRRQAVLFWMLIWVTFALIQQHYNELLLVGFATALGLTVLFAELENPASYINKESGLFGREILHSFISELIVTKKEFYGFSFIISSTTVEIDYRRLTITIADFLSALSKCIVFNNETNSYMVCTNNLDYMYSLFNTVDNFLQQTILNDFPGLRFEYVILDDYTIFTDINDILNLYTYVRKTKKWNNTIKANKELAIELRERERMKREIMAALDEDRITVFYQPIYDTRVGKFASAEALVRMFDSSHKLIPPGKFIPLAEESGLVIEIGERVFNKVCEFLNSEKIENLGLNYIEVNLSALQCEQKDLYSTFRDIMTKNHISSNQINLEITETVQLDPSPITTKNITEFHLNGISLSLDDFGTGSSNLDYITTMPVNIIKFDYTMTQNYFKNEKTQVIFKHIIPMVQELNMEIVCEGVETEEQYNTMCSFGIEHIQGYYFSKPVSENDFIKFLKVHNVDE